MNVVRFQSTQPQAVRFGNTEEPKLNKAKAIDNFNRVQEMTGLVLDRIERVAASNNRSVDEHLKNTGGSYTKYFEPLAKATQATGIRLDYTHADYV